MPIIIKQAQTSKQLMDIMEHRYQSKFGKPGRAVDALDILPTTLNVLAFENNEISGTARSVHFDPKEKLSEAFPQFIESCSKLKGTFALIDNVSISVPAYRLNVIYQYLIKLCIFRLSLRGYGYVFYNSPAEMKDILLNIGFRELSELNSKSNLIPMVLKMDEFIQAFEKKFADKEILRFREVFYYSIFDAGEVLVIEGERGNTAYVADSGGVDVVVQNNEQLISISQIPTGVLIGEVAMITNEPRTASLICKEQTPCVSFDRGEFFKIMYLEPHRSVEIFKILSRRLSASNKRIAELKKA